jgi:hypothetical protein
MRNLLSVWIVLGLSAIALLAACDAPPVDSASLPTVMVLPTLTETPTPTVTPEPSLSHTPTFTLTPSVTATATETSTPEPTSTAQPSATLTPSDTPTPTDTPTATASTTSTSTNTRAPTRTRTNTPRPSATPTRTITAVVQVVATNAFPSITSFTASSVDAAGGAQIVLRWEAQGDEAKIDQQDANGLVQTTTDVPVSGELNVIVPNAPAGRVYYRLVIKRGLQEITQTLEVRVQVQCAVNWFFGNEFVTGENVGCPPAAAVQVTGAYQPMEMGMMFNLNIDGQNLIYALVRLPGKNGQYASDQYGTTVNNWDGVSNFCTVAPPPGLLLPAQQFGWMACTQFALGGLWIDGIGYATASIDLSARNAQRATDGTLFVDAPDGTVYRLNPLLPGALTATWKRIK